LESKRNIDLFALLDNIQALLVFLTVFKYFERHDEVSAQNSGVGLSKYPERQRGATERAYMLVYSMIPSLALGVLSSCALSTNRSNEVLRIERAPRFLRLAATWQ